MIEFVIGLFGDDVGTNARGGDGGDRSGGRLGFGSGRGGHGGVIRRNLILGLCEHAIDFLVGDLGEDFVGGVVGKWGIGHEDGSFRDKRRLRRQLEYFSG